MLRFLDRYKPDAVVASHTGFDPNLEPPLRGQLPAEPWTDIEPVSDFVSRTRKAGRALIVLCSRESRPLQAATQLSAQLKADRQLPMLELQRSSKRPESIHDWASFTGFLLSQYRIFERPNIVIVAHTPLSHAIENREAFDSLKPGWHITKADPRWQNHNYEPAAEQQILPELYEQRYQTEM